jgi:hypothetical protein
MLVSKTYNKDEIVSFKLVNGDEIIAKLVEVSDDSFLISKPTTVIPSERGMGLLQSFFTGDLNKEITLDKKHVMMHTKTIKEMENHYIKTTTGIEPVGNGGILL